MPIKKLLKILRRASVPVRLGLTQHAGIQSARMPTLLCQFGIVSNDRHLWPQASSQILEET
jgi:hypothetical protein